MSSARRLQEDYRRIVGITDEGRRLDDALPRMRIDGQRGIFQIGTGESKSGSAASDTDDESTQGTNPVMPDENESNQNSDGSGQGDVNTDAPATDGEDFQTDPDNPPPNTDTSSDAFGGNWASGGPSTFVDCEDGTCIEVVEVGGYLPPDGWGDADSPPTVPDWDFGFWWSGTVNASQIDAVSFSEWCSRCPNTISVPLDGDMVPADKISCTLDGANSGRVRYRLRPPAPPFEPFWNAARQTCPAPSGDLCPTTAPIIGGGNWPADNCIQLAPNADGNFAASSRENPNDMTAKYSEPKSQLDLCTPGGENVQIFKGKDGGNVRWNVNQQRWAASGPDGRYTRFGGASSVQEQLAPNAGTPKAPPP